MGEILVAIALLCQVHGNHTGMDGLSYEKVKEKQKTCQQKLIKCVYAGEQLSTPKKLADCVTQGEY